MISVIVIWLYVILITGLAGVFVLHACEKLWGYMTNDVIPILLLGVGVVTVYAQIFSLFTGVGLWANVLLVVILVITGFCDRRYIAIRLKNIATEDGIINHKTKWIVYTILFLLMAYGTSHGIMHYDTALYHAQSIRWIEEYGVVPGLGNLHCRLGYNSAAFPMTALFSFAFMGGRSYHVMAGFLALICAWECIGLVRNIKTHTLSVSLFARFMAIYYLLIIFDEMVSPASDYYMVTLAFVFFIRLLDVCENRRENKCNSVSEYTMLAFLAAFILTIKLSGALLVLVAILPVIFYVKEKKAKEIVAAIMAGVIIVLPYLIRNVIISGWLLYPSTAIDLFNPDYKIDKGAAKYDFMEIQVYGRGYSDVSRYSESIGKWFGDWLRLQSGLDKLFILAAIVGVAYFVVKYIYYGFTLFRHKKADEWTYDLLPEGLITISFLFWLFSSPLMRYGCLYVYLIDAIIWGGVVSKLARKKQAVSAVFVILGVVMIYKGVMFVTETTHQFRADTLIWQQDYDNYETYPYSIGDITVYAPAEGDRTGYDDFPSSPWIMEIELRGDDLSDGFVSK